MSLTMPTAAELLGGRRRILVNDGAVVRLRLRVSTAQVFNLDKLGCASDCTTFKQVLAELGERTTTQRYAATSIE
jgi:dTDP-glucose 4,6-dehydratase